MQEVTYNSIERWSGLYPQPYTIGDFKPFDSENLSASRINELVTQYANLEPYPLNWDKEDHVLEGLASMKTSYDNMKKIYDMFHDNIKSLSETEDSLKRNQKAITAQIASLKGRFGDKLSAEETSQIKEIEDRNNGMPLPTPEEIQQSQDSEIKNWEKEVFSLPWGNMEDHGAAQMEAAEKLNA